MTKTSYRLQNGKNPIFLNSQIPPQSAHESPDNSGQSPRRPRNKKPNAFRMNTLLSPTAFSRGGDCLYTIIKRLVRRRLASRAISFRSSESLARERQMRATAAPIDRSRLESAMPAFRKRIFQFPFPLVRSRLARRKRRRRENPVRTPPRGGAQCEAAPRGQLPASRRAPRYCYDFLRLRDSHRGTGSRCGATVFVGEGFKGEV